MPYSTQTRVFQVEPDNPSSEAITVAAEAIRAGRLVVFPTETVYGLGANALDAAAVDRIYRAKGRPASDPIIVHIHSINQLSSIADPIPETALTLARELWPGPLTLVLRRHSSIPPTVSAGLDTVAVRMPSHPVALALLRAANVPVAAPSANLFAHPSATTAQHALDDLRGRVDIVLDSGPATIGLESTVLDLTQTLPTVLRPGGVSLERLRVLIPEIRLQSQYLHLSDTPASSPGMLLKHYSPRAELVLFGGETTTVIARMQQAAIDRIRQGQQIGIMIPDSEYEYFRSIPAQIRTLGGNLEQIGHNLFNVMRELDSLGVAAILTHGFPQTGIGVALWDRLLRAAEGRVIEG